MLAEASLLVALSVDRGAGAEGCLDAARLSRSVERRLRRHVFAPAANASLVLKVTFERHGSEIEARINLADADGTARGTRSLITSSHCSALDDSLALSVALLVDQPDHAAAAAPSAEPAAKATEPPEPPAKSAAPRASPPAEPPPTPILIPPEVAAPREPWHLDLGVTAGVGWGNLPSVKGALGAYVRLTPRQFFPTLLEGEGYWPANAERDDLSGARLRLLRLGLAVCPLHTSGERFSAALCAGQKIGWLRAEGYGFDHDRQERRLTLALSTGGEARLRLVAPVSIRGYLGLEVPLVRDAFISAGRNPTRVFEPSLVAVSGAVGLETAFW